jgi:hypothetical protein
MESTFGIEDIQWTPTSQQTGAVLSSQRTFNNPEIT